MVSEDCQEVSVLFLSQERMLPKRRNKRKCGDSEVTDANTEAPAVTTQHDEDGQGTTSTDSGRSRSTDPLTKGDIQVIIQEIMKRLEPENNGAHTPLRPSMFICTAHPPHASYWCESPTCKGHSWGPGCLGVVRQVITCTFVIPHTCIPSKPKL